MFALLNRNYSTRSPVDPLYFAETNGNPGNYYASYAVEKMFGLTEENTLFVSSPGMGRAKDFHTFRTKLPELKVVFLVLQDYLRETFESDPDGEDDWYDHVSRYVEIIDPGVRLVVLGLCANALAPFPQPYDLNIMSYLTPIKRRLFTLLSRHASEIGVRGEATKAILKQDCISNVSAVGCPTLFEEGPDRVVRPPDWSKKLGITGKLIHALPNLDAHYYLQSEEDWPMIAELQDPTSRLSMEGRYHYFTDPSDWKAHIQENCSCVVGTRLHGAIVALNAGVPAIVTNTDMRAKETCSFMNIPMAPIDPTGLLQKGLGTFFDTKSIDLLNTTYRKRYANFVTWAGRLGLPIRKEYACHASL